jgi:DNA-binding response OmpR family regulator
VKRKRILVVDDEAYITHILEFSLGMEGYEVLAATCGEEGLALAEEQQPDLIVLDIMMPGMDGFEVCRRIRNDERLADIPVIMLTAKEAPEDRRRGLEVGASAYVTKPFRPIELVRQIRQLIETMPAPGEEAVGM